MYNPTMRLLSILELLQSHDTVSAQDLAAILEVDERSIRRYIMMLRDSGFPIESERGRYGGYSLQPGFRLTPLMFNRDEIVAITVGLMLMNELGGIPTLAVHNAMSKIERVLPPELSQQSHALRQFLTLDVPFTHDVSSHALLMIGIARLNHQCVSIKYPMQRIISPYGVVLHGRAWYIPAYCHLREDLRLFRLDRIQDVAESEAVYHSMEINPHDYVLNSLAHMPGIHTFEIMFHAPLETVSAYIPQSMGVLKEINDETHFTCYSDDAFWLARFLFSCEVSFSVLENNALRDALRTIAARVISELK